jgi:ribose transport system ATP-binding protein
VSLLTPSPRSELLEARGIVKTFGGATALDGVRLEVQQGEVHALLGANGAGKSTLIKVLAGIHRADAGTISWRGEPLQVRNLREAADAGIAVMFQQLNVVEDLTVGQYLSLGREKSRFGVIERNHSEQLAEEALRTVGVRIPLRRSAASLSVAERELVEIARAVSLDARLVIMDEPTASLGEPEVAQLFEVIDRLRARGVAVVYVSHKLEEVLAITDRATVFRDGKNAGTVITAQSDKESLLHLMVGDQPPRVRPHARPIGQARALELVNVSTRTGLRGISLTLHRGEILGVYGLMGAGRTELLRACYGLDPIESGEMLLDGLPFRPKSPRDATEAGFGLVPEDRVREALIPDGSVAFNITLAAESKVTSGFIIDRRKEHRLAASAVESIGIKIPSLAATIGSLSGGNQQKVVFGRWLVSEARILLLDDPTVGVDVAAKADIYEIIRAMTDSGVSVLVCSSELEELLLLSDRIAILHQRSLVGMVDPHSSEAASVIRRAIVGTEVQLVEPE